ncbi:hypothetical protein pkur_cds_321 [Pandoravirus kuranda]|uniref:Uncharacterized protein n=1 Tax=Pandoravirus kuranda TaxID=3019033 RepID=A0AA95ECG2_9VIRU|nr:hypothetical protein pkur_cds_321 [Pandoravirus kuranda]
MSTLRERFANLRDNTRARTTQPPPAASSSSGATSGAASRHAASPAQRPAPQAEIFETLSATLPPAPVARNGTGVPPPQCPPPSAAPTNEASETARETTPRTPDRASRSKGRRATDGDGDAQATPATRKVPLSKGVLIVAGVFLLLALFIGTIVIKRGLLAGLKQRRAAKKKAAGLDDGDVDDDDGDADSDNNGKGKVGGMLGGFFGGKDKSEPTGTTKAARSAGPASAVDPRHSRVAASVPPMDPYQGRAVRTPAGPVPTARSPMPSAPPQAGYPHAAGPHGPAPQQQQQQQLYQQPPTHPVYQQQQQQQQQNQQALPQQPHPAVAPAPAPQQPQPHRQASPRMALGHVPHQQHPPYAPHVQARLDGVPHPNMPPSTPQAGRLSPGGARA